MSDHAANPETVLRWLEEEPWLGRVLHWFLDRLDTPRNSAITRRVTETSMPELFRFGENTRFRWSLIESLEKDYRVFEIRRSPGADFDEAYANAQLRLLPACEPLLRLWLKRPQIDPLLLEWQQAIDRNAHRFQDDGAALRNGYLEVAGLTAAELVAGFADVGALLDQPLTLRELSARCFGGDSKLLDKRQELLLRLFGERAERIVPRPLLLTAYAPSGFDSLLIVENQDSFLRLVDQRPTSTALLYSSGFRASAGRLLSEHTRFAFMPDSDPHDFSARWRSPDIAAGFWGDLDYAGLGILAALRRTLCHLQSWQPGYQPMVELLLAGGGHLPEQARKSGQVDPLATGCEFADRVLLPALREQGRFVDQEALRPPIR